MASRNCLKNVTLIICPECQQIKKNTRWLKINKEKLVEICKKQGRNMRIILDLCPKCLEGK